MIGSGLKKLARENGMQIDGGVAFGMLKGCFVTLSEGAGYKRMSIYIGYYPRQINDLPQNENESEEIRIPEHLRAAQAVAEYIEQTAADFKTYRLMNAKQHKFHGVAVKCSSVVQVNFFDNPGTMKCIQAFVEDILPQVAPMTNVLVCAKCGEPNDSQSVPLQRFEDAVVPVHQTCAQEIVNAVNNRKQSQKAGAGKTLLGIIGAAVGALIGAALWTLVGIIGYVASIVGLAIAFLASKGYELLGGKPGTVKLITVIVCVILAVIVGTVGTEIYYLHDYYQEEVAKLEAWEEAIPEMEFLAGTIPMLWEDAEVLGALAKDVLMGLFFAALGCFGLLRDAAGKGTSGKIRILKG